jgi:hypothetical protein
VSLPARLLALTGGDDAAHETIVALRRFVLAFGAARAWLWLAFDAGPEPAASAGIALAATACAVLAWIERTATLAPRLALPLLVAQLAATFPTTNNHFYVELLVVGLLALVDRSGDGEAAALGAIRWVTALVLLWSGLQKAAYGLYFGGEFLAFMTARADRFADAFRWLLPADELARLLGLRELRAGAGPFRVAAPAFVVASNAVWIFEIVLGVLLLLRRTRVVAAVAAIAMVLLLQLGAREAGFALLFTGLLATFLPRAPRRGVLIAVVALLAYAVIAAFGVLPGRTLLEGVNP